MIVECLDDQFLFASEFVHDKPELPAGDRDHDDEQLSAFA